MASEAAALVAEARGDPVLQDGLPSAVRSGEELLEHNSAGHKTLKGAVVGVILEALTLRHIEDDGAVVALVAVGQGTASTARIRLDTDRLIVVDHAVELVDAARVALVLEARATGKVGLGEGLRALVVRVVHDGSANLRQRDASERLGVPVTTRQAAVGRNGRDGASAQTALQLVGAVVDCDVLGVGDTEQHHSNGENRNLGGHT